MSKNILKLSGLLKVNGKQFKELAYDVQNLTVLDIMTASRNKAKACGNMDVSQKVAELDAELHFFVGIQAIVKQNPEIDNNDLINLSGSDAYQLMQIGRSFFKVDSFGEESATLEEPQADMQEDTTAQ